jgi:hypothetical protein
VRYVRNAREAEGFAGVPCVRVHPRTSAYVCVSLFPPFAAARTAYILPSVT